MPTRRRSTRERITYNRDRRRQRRELREGNRGYNPLVRKMALALVGRMWPHWPGIPRPYQYVPLQGRASRLDAARANTHHTS